MDEILSWYKFVSTSLRLARNAVKSYPPPDRIYDKTDLGRAYLESPEQFQQFRSVEMEQIKQKLDEATILMLYAAFERSLLLHIQNTMLDVFSKYTPSPWIEEIAFLIPEKAERWEIKKLLGLFKKELEENPENLEKIKQLYEYRNWLAHGKKGASPASIRPLEAYHLLSAFLQHTHIPEY